MKIPRDILESMALGAVDEDLYYELQDNLEITTDEELYQIVAGTLEVID